MANRSPVQSAAFKQQQAPKYGDQALGKTVGIRFVAEVDAVLREMDDRQQYIRDAVVAKLIEDGLIEG
jgi:hypothetical protein